MIGPPNQVTAHSPSGESTELMNQGDAMAGCMTLEFSVPRVLALLLVGAALLAQLIEVAATGRPLLNLTAVPARAPPGSRRQALLGVFLS